MKNKDVLCVALGALALAAALAVFSGSKSCAADQALPNPRVAALINNFGDADVRGRRKAAEKKGGLPGKRARLADTLKKIAKKK
jgi:hypothetical protein